MSYVIEGGAQGKARLNILGQAMNKYSIAVLREAGIAAGQRCLDAGCGGGTMTYEIAHIVSASGSVTGIDFDESIIKLNQQDIEAEGISNISFRQGNIYELSEDARYDIVFARFLLSHLAEPARAVANMMRVLKPGGRLVLEDIQFSAHIHYPHCPAMETYMKWYTVVVDKNKGDAERGAYLHTYLDEAGFKDIHIQIAQPVAREGAAKMMSLVTLEKIKNALLEHKITDEAGFDTVYKELKAFTEYPHTVISIPRVFQVWGARP